MPATAVKTSSMRLDEQTRKDIAGDDTVRRLTDELQAALAKKEELEQKIDDIAQRFTRGDVSEDVAGELAAKLGGLRELVKAQNSKVAMCERNLEKSQGRAERASLESQHAALDTAIRAFDAKAKDAERALVMMVLNSIREFRAGVANRDAQHRELREIEKQLASQFEVYLADTKLSPGYYHGIDRAATGRLLETPETMALIGELGIHRENYRTLLFNFRELARIA